VTAYIYLMVIICTVIAGVVLVTVLH